MNYEQELEFARTVAKEAGKHIMEFYGKVTIPKFLNQVKGIASNVDSTTDALIKEAIKGKFSQHGIITEESDAEKQDAEYVWLADPLDGTINFVRQKPDFAVTIALMRNRIPIIGVTHIPVTKDEYFAVQGEGSYHNEKRVRTSPIENLSDAVVHIETNFKKYPQNLQVREILTEPAGRLHALNSSAIELAYVASGKSDARVYFGPIFELAAGALQVQEAGGKVANMQGELFSLHSHSIIASNGKIQQELERILCNVK